MKSLTLLCLIFAISIQATESKIKTIIFPIDKKALSFSEFNAFNEADQAVLTQVSKIEALSWTRVGQIIGLATNPSKGTCLITDMHCFEDLAQSVESKQIFFQSLNKKDTLKDTLWILDLHLFQVDSLSFTKADTIIAKNLFELIDSLPSHFGKLFGDTTLKKDIIPPQAKDMKPWTQDTSMSFVKGACYQMGSESGGDDEKPSHRVCISDFYMDKTEVTQKQYSHASNNNPSFCHTGLMGKDMDCPDCPVEQVTWFEASSYCERLGKRLPTEAEWEFAARGGVKSKHFTYAGNNDPSRVGWSLNNTPDKSQKVALKDTNELGIYDLSGNVKEWVVDNYEKEYYSHSPKDNPQGPNSGDTKVIRGGGWSSPNAALRNTIREDYPADLKENDIGFRCVAP